MTSNYSLAVVIQVKLETRRVLLSRQCTLFLPSSIEFLSRQNKHFPQVSAKIIIKYARRETIAGKKRLKLKKKKNSDLLVR